MIRQLLLLFTVFFLMSSARPVRVNILSKYHPSELTISNTLEAYHIKLLGSKLLVNGSEKKFFETTVVQDQKKNFWKITIKDKTRNYIGIIRLRPVLKEIQVINLLNVEDYLIGVLAAEFGKADIEALKAQAVLSRTLVYLKMYQNRHLPSDLGDLTNDQAYQGFLAHQRFAEAISKTSGLVMTYHGSLIEVFWHAVCGNKFLKPNEIWGGTELKYLKTITGPRFKNNHRCSQNPHYQWQRELTLEEINEIFQKSIKYEVFEPYPMLKAQKIYLAEDKSLFPEHFRLKINRINGWNFLKSNDYQIIHSGNTVLFKGNGLGHNIGFCQCEANAFSKEGLNYQQILRKYYQYYQIQPIFNLPKFHLLAL